MKKILSLVVAVLVMASVAFAGEKVTVKPVQTQTSSVKKVVKAKKAVKAKKTVKKVETPKTEVK